MPTGKRLWIVVLAVLVLAVPAAPHVLAASSWQARSGSRLHQLADTPARTDASLQAATARPTNTPAPSPSPTRNASSRPQIGIKYAGAAEPEVYAGEDFELRVTLINSGESKAFDIQCVFTPGDLIPRNNGGVVNMGDLPAGADNTFHQAMTADDTLYGMQFALTTMTVTYTDSAGNPYADTFNISVPLTLPPSSGYASATPTVITKPQLVIVDYSTDASPLEPGVQFALDLTIRNTGTSTARQVVMIAGGGSASTGGGETPQPGGVSGGSGQFSTFAPVGGSNVQSLGDVPAGNEIAATQELIVNVTVTPGAYPFPISFSYVDDKGISYTDEQVITLLVYNLPDLDISFYRDPNPIIAGQPNQLPLQVVNLGKAMVVLGNMRVTASAGALENGQALVGPLEAGGYFTLDSSLIPDVPGGLELTVSVDYTDDFNAPRTISQILELEVQEGFVEPSGPVVGPGEGEVIGEPSAETAWQRALRFLRGLFGLESAPPTSGPEAGATEPPAEVPAVPGPKG